ncbi:ABC transporter substrate-binding protein [Microbacterium telephonicum]|uniref:Multiple sugar transport system substrate-binding protein/putative aldouronate transport system substrate-binding protein n=1 Tax=Microbacterium telephonicum TaxID=1714841 RepID=A0A498CC52_9MICO|nr:ABC transporter substrate-binding protein [Microbacterium telephonicum]RLK52659.1 multiple sugar transport system substrate-binding protein/putative aldouronate transport system substrate-binding protein [Microbacterium telephonicum]
MKLTRKVMLTVAAIVTAGSLASCSGTAAPTRSAIDEFPDKWDDEITIDVFDGLANYMGIQQGWFAKIVKDKFNMKLNIIAPNVAGGGDTLYNTRVAAGDLGDMIITDKGQKLDELVQGGLVMDVSDIYPAMDNAAEYDAAVQNLAGESGGIYAFPTSVSSLKPTEASEGLNPTFGPFIRWDLYKQLGYPELGTLEDLIPVLEQMHELEPTAPNGKPTYAFSLFKDWDGNMMNNAKQPATFYGYDEMGFVLAQADGSDYQSILDADSGYIRSLRLYFEANKLGLVDPESTTQNYDTLYSKFQNGQVMFSWWPWLGQTAYNTEDNMAAGKGFEIAPVADQKIFSYGAEAYGGKQVFAIGSKAEDPERIAAFIDWLYSPEGAYANSAQTQGSAGPQGLTWDLNAEGEPELTEFGNQVFLQGGGNVPEEWGGGDYADGVSALNAPSVLPVSVDPATGFPYSYTFWPSYQEATANALSEDWSAQMGGATSTMEYLQNADQITVAPGASYTAPADSSEIETLRNQVKAVIVQYSWQMVFATSDSQFDSLLKEMQDTAAGLGYDKVLEVDMANAKDQNDQRVAIAKEFG